MHAWKTRRTKIHITDLFIVRKEPLFIVVILVRQLSVRKLQDLFTIPELVDDVGESLRVNRNYGDSERSRY